MPAFFASTGVEQECPIHPLQGMPEEHVRAIRRAEVLLGTTRISELEAYWSGTLHQTRRGASVFQVDVLVLDSTLLSILSFTCKSLSAPRRQNLEQ